MDKNSETITLDEVKKSIEKHTGILNAVFPPLKYDTKQIKDQKEARKYIEEWANGRYSFESLENFVIARYDYLFSKTEAGKNLKYDRKKLLDYLFNKEPLFRKMLYEARESAGLNIVKAPNIEFDNIYSAYDSLEEQYASVDCDIQEKMPSKMQVKIVDDILQKFNLSDTWYDVVFCQIVSPEVKQVKVLSKANPPRHFFIKEMGPGSITVCFSPNFSNSENEVLMDILRVIKPLARGCKKEKDTIWDFIEDDRGKHLSWKKLENKYDIPFDTIKKRLKYRAKN